MGSACRRAGVSARSWCRSGHCRCPSQLVPNAVGSAIYTGRYPCKYRAVDVGVDAASISVGTASSCG